jgi:hypothetical protein
MRTSQSDSSHAMMESANPGSFGASARSTLRLLEVRLRIPAVLIVSAILVGQWETIRNYRDRLFRASSRSSIATQAVSSDTEYFCPMDPGVVSDWPGKCGICNMALVRRKRGEAVALPDGVVARMQLSPYRIQLAGIRTAPAGFRPLERTFETAGIVRQRGGDLIVPLEISPRAAPWIKEGQAAKVRSVELGREAPMSGRLEPRGKEAAEADGSRVTLRITNPDPTLRPGMMVELQFATPVSELEPFRSLPAEAAAPKPGEPRLIYVCPLHNDAPAAEQGHCPIDHEPLEARPLADNQRVRWWCPMHPGVTSKQAGSACAECGGMALQPRVVSYRPAGKVLAIPESAVVDTGTRTVVFVESMPGMFDGVEVALGPRCGDDYPVVSGLEAGQNVAVAGAFLLDAETRLNPSLAAGYFGAAGRESSATSSRTSQDVQRARRGDAGSPLDQLPEADRALARSQAACPVTRKALGSMGVPPRVVVAGRIVFLCCDGCEDALRSNPAKYLARLPAEPHP